MRKKPWPQRVNSLREHARQMIAGYRERNWQVLFGPDNFKALRAVSDGTKR